MICEEFAGEMRGVCGEKRERQSRFSQIETGGNAMFIQATGKDSEGIEKSFVVFSFWDHEK